MSEPLSDLDRQMMDTLIRRAHDLACHLQDAAMACEDPAEKRALAGDFHRVARAFRQTLALKLRVHRVTEQARRADAAEADAARTAERTARERDARGRVAGHRRRIEDTLTRLVNERCDWDEAEAGDDLDRIALILDDEESREEFMATPAEVILARVARHVNLNVRFGPPPEAPDGTPDQDPADLAFDARPAPA